MCENSEKIVSGCVTFPWWIFLVFCYHLFFFTFPRNSSLSSLSVSGAMNAGVPAVFVSSASFPWNWSDTPKSAIYKYRTPGCQCIMLNTIVHIVWTNYRPQTKLQEGNVFSHVCQSVCPGKHVPICPLWTCSNTSTWGLPRTCSNLITCCPFIYCQAVSWSSNWKAFLLKIISYFDLNKLIILPPSIQLEFTLTWSSSLSSRLDGLISLWIIFWWCTAEKKHPLC